ncbi:hypothetical protein Emed_002037 [Eimeria media]
MGEPCAFVASALTGSRRRISESSRFKAARSTQQISSLYVCCAATASACCYPQHTELVLRRLSSVADIPQCRRVSEEVLCVLCDPRFGLTHVKKPTCLRRPRAAAMPSLFAMIARSSALLFLRVSAAAAAAAAAAALAAAALAAAGAAALAAAAAAVSDAHSFCRGLGYEVFADETDASHDAHRRSQPCFDGVPLASSRAAPKRIERSGGYGRDREGDAFRHWFDRLMLRVYDLLNRPEVWLLVFMLGYLVYQGVQFAKDIIKTHLMQERQQHREQILLRYGVQEEELESCDASEEEEEEGSPRVTISDEEEKESETNDHPKNVQKNKKKE